MSISNAACINYRVPVGESLSAEVSFLFLLQELSRRGGQAEAAPFASFSGLSANRRENC
jgi:hypothetical protein